ncbi:iron-containing alcohol dehydrogenase family protein [cf. Phormidesmis sp. LEGE 11477]|uniref:iron-containing alcohol dehydrogenase family protein n=1 Tax=cf. Phormidesmis sp. LEGE 11477 TaxID=1828680 RepID=UPI00187F0A14|nr:iron-containing alcohol dehydrogenase family protein [cf. Phormidesmis sp. LEGE 11477]MBE9064439.1 iron-containing alcohol dehydrogenase family protein [cf. Phormidesmis sp. LEGE 11477]
MPLSTTFPILNIAPAQVIRGNGVLAKSGDLLSRLGSRPLLVGGQKSLPTAQAYLAPALTGLASATATYTQDCSEVALASLNQSADAHSADFVIGIGGGKALDAAKLLAYQRQLPIVTVPTSAATCAGWTALSNVYSEAGAFLYDVGLPKCPEAIVLDYDLVATAPQRTLVAGIGDAIAKWYEASVSSGHSTHTMIIGAVQQARVLRDILFQKSASAIANPGSDDWKEVVDASVLMAGVIGGMGGAQCRTVAAHAVHNGLTHVSAHSTLHGEKVAYGILVQLRLEEMAADNSLAATARQQLIQFYDSLGLPTSLTDMGMDQLTVAQLEQAATVACQRDSDIHHLPFPVQPAELMAAMISTTLPIGTVKQGQSATGSKHLKTATA